MRKDNYFILTGAMGAGKSTVLSKLKEKNYICIEEPARVILKEQRAIGGEGLPEINPALFNELMLSRMISQYKENFHKDEITIFDRGITDLIAYAQLFEIDLKIFTAASNEYKYNKNVFMFNGREEIYATDEERKVDFKIANDFGISLKRIYEALGYSIIDVLFVTMEERVSFILHTINNC